MMFEIGPRIGFGGGALADYPWNLDKSKPWSQEDDKEAIAILESLDGMGIDFIDTANRYGNGVSEETIGRAMKHSKSCDIVTKIDLGTIPEMIQRYQESLKRLHRIEGLLLHNPDLARTKEIDAACEWMKTLGLKWTGFSTEPARETKLYYNNHGLNAIEFPYSFWDRRAEDEIFPWSSDLFRIANRVLGGPSLNGRAGKLRDAICFILSRAGFIDVFLIGTRSKAHLKDCVQITQELLGLKQIKEAVS